MAMRHTTRRHGAWARVTRAWLVAMMIGIFALTLVGPASAAAPPAGGGTTTRPPVGTGIGTPPIVQPTTTPISANPGVGFFTCDLYQCITTVHVEAAGRGVGFVIFDSQSSVATVQLSKVAPKKNASGDFFYDAGDVTAFSLSPKGNTHSVEFTGLDSGTTYYYLINAAKGSVGADAQKTGTVTTLKRYVTTTINTITVIDDSDALSDGDLVFNLKVNGSNPAIYPDQALIDFNPANGSTTEWASGDSRNVDIEVKVVSGGQATVTLEGWDWDSNQQGWLNGQPINIDQDTVGISGDRADASTTIDISGDDDSSPVWKPFTLQTTNKSLKFKATGYISTTYAP